MIEMEAGIEGLVAGLPDILDPNGRILGSWNHIQNSLKISGVCVNTASVKSNEDSENYDSSLRGRNSASLLFHIVKARGQEVSQLTSEQVCTLEKALVQLENVCFPFIFLLFARFLFYSRYRQAGEKVEDYFQALEILSETCEFGCDKDYIVKQHFMRRGEISSSLRHLIQESSPLSLKNIFSAFLIQRKSGNSNVTASYTLDNDSAHSSIIVSQLKRIKKRDMTKLADNLNLKSVKGIKHTSIILKASKKKEQSKVMRQAQKSNLRSPLSVKKFRGLYQPSVLSAKQRKLISGIFPSKGNERFSNKNSSKQVSEEHYMFINSEGNVLDEAGIADSVVKPTQSSQSNQKSLTRTLVHDIHILKDVDKKEEGTSDHAPPALEASVPSVDVELGENSFTCQTCKLMFSQLDEYKDHIKTHICQCDLCGTKFAYPSLLDRHMSKHTGIKHVGKRLTGLKDKPVRNKLYCSSCLLTFPSAIRFKNHMMTYCSICNTDCSNHNCNHDKTVKCSSKKQKQHSCDLCGAVFNGIYELYKHNRMHTQQYKIKDATMLKEHDISHTKDKITVIGEQGQQCSQTPSRPAPTKQQMSHYKGTQECSICGEKFTKKFYLKNHMRIHSGETPYTCELCSACFKSQWNLSRHYLVHTGAKPHVCTVCNKSFKWQSTLSAHIRSQHRSPGPSHQLAQLPQKNVSLSTGPSIESSLPPALPPPPLLYPQGHDSLEMRGMEALQPCLSQHRNFQERYQHPQQLQLPQSLPASSHTDQIRMTAHPHTGAWSPFFGGIPTQRPDWLYWTE